MLRSNPMKELIKERANEIAERAGEGYTTSPYVGKNRVNSAVWTTTPEAIHDNNRNNTLLKSLR